MVKSMKNTIRVQKPHEQEIVLNTRYDKEWGCHFLSLQVFDHSFGDHEPIGEEVTICLNNKAELDKFLGLLTKSTAKIKV
jgi:hypothetical protein